MGAQKLVMFSMALFLAWMTENGECYYSSRAFMLTSSSGSYNGYKRAESSFESCHLRLDHTQPQQTTFLPVSSTYTTLEITRINDHQQQPSVENSETDETTSNSGSITEGVYAGNGHNYAINCHVNDPKMRTGDKYYVIDLIVYGPNQRVAKAWREQFTTASFMSNGKSFFLNKNLSFYWLGENNIVCGVRQTQKL